MCPIKFNGVKHEKERHFSLQPLITALDTYVTYYNYCNDKDRKLHWCTVVGLAQTLLPAHIRHHYCDREESFWKGPSFQKPKLQRSLEFYNRSQGAVGLWGSDVDWLGQDFGMYTPGQGGCLSSHMPDPRAARADLAALKVLNETRTSIDMPSLIKRLYTPIQNLEENYLFRA